MKERRCRYRDIIQLWPWIKRSSADGPWFLMFGVVKSRLKLWEYFEDVEAQESVLRY